MSDIVMRYRNGDKSVTHGKSLDIIAELLGTRRKIFESDKRLKRRIDIIILKEKYGE